MGLFNRKKPVDDRKNRERRRHARISDSLKINYKLATDALRTNCRSADISEGGIRFNLYQKLKIGDTLKLEICLKDSTEPLSAIGSVAWIGDTSDKEYPFEAGIEFNVFAHSFLNEIKTHIQSITINKIS